MSSWLGGFATYLRRTRRWWLLAWGALMIWGIALAALSGGSESTFVYTLS